MSIYQEKKLPSTITVPSSSSFLNIDTRDQIKADADGYISNSYKNPFDISIYKPDNITMGRILRMSLTNFNMLWNAPNVNPYNNVLVLEAPDPLNPGNILTHTLSITKPATLGTQQDEVTSLTTAFYDFYDLANAVQTALLADNPFGYNTWYCGYVNFRFIIGTSNTQTPLKLFRVNPMIGKYKGVGADQNGIQYVRTSTLANVMGYINASKAFATTLISDTPSMQYTRYIDVVSNELTSYQHTKDFSTADVTGRNLIARIFLSENMKQASDFTYNQNTEIPVGVTGYQVKLNQLGQKPFTINYEPTNPKYMKWDSATNLSGLNIRIQDEFGNLVYEEQPSPIAVPNGTTNNFTIAGSSSYCQMTFTVTEGDN